MSGPRMSVVVCTYNRADLLPGCLLALADQSADPSRFEVIVVDNNSRDATAEIAGGFAARYPHFRAVRETRQGLSHARNRGWEEARGEYVAYIDDDAKAFPDWVERMLEFAGRNPDVSVFGGPYVAFCTAPIPAWFPPDYGSWTLGGGERRIRIGQEWINGTNMVYRRRVLAELGGFSKDLGMKGGTISYGEETHLLLRIDRAGLPVHFVPSMRVEHLLAPYKLSLAWMLRSSYGLGASLDATLGRKRGLASILRGLAKQGLKGLLKLLAPAPLPFKRRLYFALDGVAQEIGALSARLKGI